MPTLSRDGSGDALYVHPLLVEVEIGMAEVIVVVAPGVTVVTVGWVVA